MPGFFLSHNIASSYPPLRQKTPDTARAFFGLCVFCVGRGTRRKESPLASLPRARIPKRSSGPFRGPRRAGGSRSETEGVFLSVISLEEPFLRPLLQSPCGRQLPQEGAFRDGGPLAVEGIHVASLSREGDRLRWKEFLLSVVSPAFFYPSLTPSVAYGDSSLGEGAIRDGGSGPREGAFSRFAGAEAACRLARRIAF